MNYNKIIVSKESEKNNCFVPNDEVLVIRSFKSPRENLSVNFEWYKNLSIKNKFGWVKNVNTFSFEDFINSYGSKIKDEDHNTIKNMLDDIKNIEDDSPVAADYLKRGIINSKIILKVHKVKFYEVKE